ncbi:nucleolar pre-ribosomal-associated protein 1 isoform X2 [Erpetoichthys calabaricus]|nr:nucleolar pre-ribosomal-associated protein 1 isoform X2 [Erpetoichthys calabaricus]
MEDRLSTVKLLISTLQKKVVHSKSITKTQKVHFFNNVVLNHIASLYRWDGIIDVMLDEIKAIELTEEVARTLVRELTHSFLLDICCSLKHGISFYDPSFGITGRSGNIVLLRFIVGLRTATQDEMIGELVVNILKVCPDLLQRYFKETQFSFVPRQTSTWLDNMKLLRKIFEAQPEISKSFSSSEFIPLPRLLQMVLVTTMPSVCSKAMFTQGLNLDDKIVKHTTLSFIAFLLRRAEKNIDYCLSEEFCSRSDHYCKRVMEDFVQNYREALCKMFPDITNIVAIWQSLTKKEQNENQTTEQGSQYKSSLNGKGAEFKEYDLSNSGVILLKAVILQVLCLYQKVIPYVITQSTFDYSKMLNGIFTENIRRYVVPPVLQHQMLKLCLDLPANKFSWFQDIREAEKRNCAKSVFYLLLKMFVTTTNEQLKLSTKQLIIKVLKETGVFEHTWKELEIWLKHLLIISEAEQETVVQFLERILVKLVSNPWPYTDIEAALVQEAISYQTILTRQEADTSCLPVFQSIEGVDVVEECKGLEEEFGAPITDEMIQQIFPFSAAVLAALEARNKLLQESFDGNDVVQRYVVWVLSDILHTQRDPAALCLAFQMYDKELTPIKAITENTSVAHFFHYYRKWIPPQAVETLFGETGSTLESVQHHASFSSLLKESFVKHANHPQRCDLEVALRQTISELQQSEFLLAVKHLMLYIKTCVDDYTKFMRSDDITLLKFYMKLLEKLVSRPCNLEESKLNRPTDINVNDVNSFFLENECVIQDNTEDQVAINVLEDIFKHPVLEQWFLARDVQTFSHISLKDDSFKVIGTEMNSGILNLLKLGAPKLKKLDCLRLISKFMNTIANSVLHEIKHIKKNCSQETEKTFSLQALEELHTFMDVIELRKLVSALLNLPKKLLTINCENDKKTGTIKKLGTLGHTLVLILRENNMQTNDKENLVLSIEHLRDVGNLMLSGASEDLEKVILHTLQKEPLFAQFIQTEVLVFCLKRMTNICLSIAAFLIQHCSVHLLQFELWCLEPQSKKVLKMNGDIFLSLINGYLKHLNQEVNIQLQSLSSLVLANLKEAFLERLLSTALSDIAPKKLALKFEILCSLIRLSLSSDDLTDVISHLPRLLERIENYQTWKLVDCVTNKFDGIQDEQSNWKKTLLMASLRWLTSSYATNKESDESMKEKELTILNKLKELIVVSSNGIDAVEWNSFIKLGLKNRYRETAFLEALNFMLAKLYNDDNIPEKFLPLPMIHMMIISHSLFLPTILNEKVENSWDLLAKESIIDILLTVVRRCGHVCEMSHIAVILGAYGASLSRQDQKLLLLLRCYEQNGVSLAEFGVLLWGPAAVEFQKARKSLGKSIWQQPSTDQILTLLDKDKMHQTLLNFPQYRHILPQSGKDEIFKDDNIKDLDSLYDPCFLLPVFSTIVKSDSVIDCQKFVYINALGVTIAALSSYDANVRAAAYYVLGSFYLQVEAAFFKEKRQLLCLLDAFKNGIRQKNSCVPFSLAVYIAKTAQQIFKPGEYMYLAINKFLLSHQYLDIKKVPGFFKMFYNSDLEHRMEREWILNLLAEGMKDRYSYEIYSSQRIFQVLLAFFSCPLSDESAKNQILDILMNAAQVTKAAYELIRDHGILGWILSILQQRYLEDKSLSKIISLVHSLWITNLSNKEKDEDCRLDPKSKKFLPLSMVNEFWNLLTIILRHIRKSLELSKICLLFKTIKSVLKHHTSILRSYQENKKIVLTEKALSCTEALILLYKWSFVTKNDHLLAEVQDVAQKHNVKEILIKENFQKKDHTQADANNTTEDTTEDTAQIDCLNECEENLRSILTKWEPCISPCHPYNSPGELSDIHRQLDHASACLIVKWELKSFGGCQTCPNDLLIFLEWLQKKILTHHVVINELLQDSLVKLSFLQLYHRVNGLRWKVDEVDGKNTMVLQIFTSVMIQLLEAQNSLDMKIHNTVMKFCLQDETEENNLNRAGCLTLLSLYIHVMWFAAKHHDIFLNYITLLMEAAEKIPKKKKDKTPGDFFSVCKELSSVLNKC